MLLAILQEWSRNFSDPLLPPQYPQPSPVFPNQYSVRLSFAPPGAAPVATPSLPESG